MLFPLSVVMCQSWNLPYREFPSALLLISERRTVKSSLVGVELGPLGPQPDYGQSEVGPVGVVDLLVLTVLL